MRYFLLVLFFISKVACSTLPLISQRKVITKLLSLTDEPDENPSDGGCLFNFYNQLFGRSKNQLEPSKIVECKKT